MWQELARHSRQVWMNSADVADAQAEVERALDELAQVMAEELGDVSRTGLQRVRSMRTAPADAEGKSHYECVNQLIHYWFCCRAASYLVEQGCNGLIARPTGHDNSADELGGPTPYDIQANHPRFGAVVAEVFCCSRSLWPKKIADTLAKLRSAPVSTGRRLVFYNREVKEKYSPKTCDVAVLTIDLKGNTAQLASTYSVGLESS